MQNRVVARYLDGRTLKGQTADFLPTRPTFHVIPSGQAGSAIEVVEVRISDLKGCGPEDPRYGAKTTSTGGMRPFSEASPSKRRTAVRPRSP